MCKLCEMKAECETLREEIEFRLHAFQKELSFGRKKEAKAAEARAHECLNLIFEILRKVPKVAEEMRESTDGSHYMDESIH